MAYFHVFQCKNMEKYGQKICDFTTENQKQLVQDPQVASQNVMSFHCNSQQKAEIWFAYPKLPDLYGPGNFFSCFKLQRREKKVFLSVQTLGRPCTYIFYLYILVPSIYVYVEAVPNEKFFMNFIEFLRWFARQNRNLSHTYNQGLRLHQSNEHDTEVKSAQLRLNFATRKTKQSIFFYLVTASRVDS